MIGFPIFIPPMLDLDGSPDEIISKLYMVFLSDFRGAELLHEGKKVIFDRRILPDGQNKEEAFWHLVERKDHKIGNRVLYYPRAKRITWVRPLIECPSHEGILVFDYLEGPKDKGVRRYIWLEKFDYIVILQHKGNKFQLITAFYIDVDGKREDLYNRYNKRL